MALQELDKFGARRNTAGDLGITGQHFVHPLEEFTAPGQRLHAAKKFIETDAARLYYEQLEADNPPPLLSLVENLAAAYPADDQRWFLGQLRMAGYVTQAMLDMDLGKDEGVNNLVRTGALTEFSNFVQTCVYGLEMGGSLANVSPQINEPATALLEYLYRQNMLLNPGIEAEFGPAF